MSAMFYYSKKLVDINLSSFDTNNVTSMERMFGECNSLEILDISNFDTSNVTNMKEMFLFDTKLKTIYAT
jgi:surface protein